MRKCFPGDWKFRAPVFFWLEAQVVMAAIGKDSAVNAAKKKSRPPTSNRLWAARASFLAAAGMSAVADMLWPQLSTWTVDCHPFWVVGPFPRHHRTAETGQAAVRRVNGA